MPLDDLHRDVASVALGAASEHGFVLGGGNALIAHGIIDRPTGDVDLFTDQEHGVRAASAAVESALSAAGFQAERQDKSPGMDDVFAGLDEEMAEGLAEWIVTAPDGRQMTLQMAYFERSRAPVVMEFGPVQDLEDALGDKTAALATRAYERDYSDVARAMQRYSPDQLMGFARRLDPGLTDRDFADAGTTLDRFSDRQLAAAGLAPEDVDMVRERFADWPREAPEREADMEAGQ
ncbi:MAG: nucleotidyl transferase AbiEii/AbiGii toxin family protein [Streptosporangiaceae bacterium]